MKDDGPREKKWRLLYLRSEKLRRAKQLGIDYPRMSQRQKLESENINILFVCSMNKWRSPTAEKIYRNTPLVNVRSAGTSSKAKHHISCEDLKWADLIIAMEPKHVQRLRADFPEVMRYMEVLTLGIEDRYGYMHPELVEELKASIDPILDNYV